MEFLINYYAFTRKLISEPKFSVYTVHTLMASLVHPMRDPRLWNAKCFSVPVAANESGDFWSVGYVFTEQENTSLCELSL